MQGEEGPDLRGGTVDALIVHATRALKNGNWFLIVNLCHIKFRVERK